MEQGASYSVLLAGMVFSSRLWDSVCFPFYNLGALIYKGFFFSFGGLKRQLNSSKGWAGPGPRITKDTHCNVNRLEVIFDFRTYIF